MRTCTQSFSFCTSVLLCKLRIVAHVDRLRSAAEVSGSDRHPGAEHQARGRWKVRLPATPRGTYTTGHRDAPANKASSPERQVNTSDVL